MIATPLQELIAAVDLTTVDENRFGGVEPGQSVLKGATMDDTLKKLTHAYFDCCVSYEAIHKDLSEKHKKIQEAFSSQPESVLNGLAQEIEALKDQALMTRMNMKILARAFQNKMIERFPQLAHVESACVHNGYIITYVPRVAPEGSGMSAE
jgi:hypothetical protein